MAISSTGSAQALDPRDGLSQGWLISAARNLAEVQCRSGDRQGGLETLEKALQVALRVESANGTAAMASRLSVPGDGKPLVPRTRSWRAGVAMRTFVPRRSGISGRG